MIQMSLLDNGVDSLKSAYLIMEQLPDLHEGIGHKLKDGVFALNHGVEILFKLILKNRSEHLLYNDLEKYMNAKRKMIEQSKANVLEATPSLKTVSLNEALMRAKYLCDISIDPRLEAAIQYLNKKRNEFMHYEVNLSEEDMLKLLDKLRVGYELSIQFFSLHIENIESKIAEARYEITVDDHMNDIAESYGMMRYEEERDLRGYEEDDGDD